MAALKPMLSAVLVVVMALIVALAMALLVTGWSAFGRSAEGARDEAMQTSSHWADGKFRNALPLRNFVWGSIRDGILSRGRHKAPASEVAVYANDGSTYATPPRSGLRVTWLGHSTMLLEIDGTTVLLDPVWGERTSPFSWLGPRRWYAPPLALADLPPIDAVVISHDHYDHLDRDTVVALKDRVNRFIVPLGVGAHLEYWGVEKAAIDELDWWEARSVGDVRITATPARHASGRHLWDLDHTLWMGIALTGPVHNVYYSGDTGLFPGFKDIGTRLGPFDLAMIEVGAYSRNWPDWHLGPEQAVIANEWVQGKRLLPVHWGLFDLALHNWTEPVERVVAASVEHNLSVVTPRPGQPLEPGVTSFAQWWPELPWESATRHPVRSSGVSLGKRELGLISGSGS